MAHGGEVPHRPVWIVRILSAHRVPVSFREIASPHGHDSFLLDIPEYHRTVAGFLQRMQEEEARRPRTGSAAS